MTAPVTGDARIAAAVRASLDRAVTAEPGVPGAVAGVTSDRETVCVEAAGVRSIDGDEPMPADATFAIFSTTKAITATCLLQLYQDGVLDLKAPAKAYLPAIGELQVITGFDDGGQPILRRPASDVTVHQLLTHTAGFGYDFFDETYARLTAEHGVPSVVSATMASLTTPLLFDPGSRWQYGSNMDWAGLVVEAVTGRRLGEVMAERIFAPLGMTDTSFDPDAARRARLATMHQRRRPDAPLSAAPHVTPPADPEVHMGGHGLVSTVGDYLKFIRMWLADGAADSGEQVLDPATVAMAAQNQLGDLKITALRGVIPALSNDAEFFPGMPKSWAYSFMVNDEPAPTGRPAGALAWAGLANLFYWIDRENRIGGYWASQILPFADAAAVTGYLDFESAVYQALGG